MYARFAGPPPGLPDGAANVLDISAIVDRMKDVSTALPEPRLWLKQGTEGPPRPDTDAINVIDLSEAVNAVKEFAYPYVPTACPGDSE